MAIYEAAKAGYNDIIRGLLNVRVDKGRALKAAALNGAQKPCKKF
jgi:hypothetical protein